MNSRTLDHVYAVGQVGARTHSGVQIKADTFTELGEGFDRRSLTDAGGMVGHEATIGPSLQLLRSGFNADMIANARIGGNLRRRAKLDTGSDANVRTNERARLDVRIRADTRIRTELRTMVEDRISPQAGTRANLSETADLRTRTDSGARPNDSADFNGGARADSSIPADDGAGL